MNFTSTEYLIALPEIFVLGMICVTLIAELTLRKKFKMISYWLAQFTLVIAAIMSAYLYRFPELTAFNNSFVLDPMASGLKFFIYIVSIFCFWYAPRYLVRRRVPLGEYYVLALFVVLGMMVLVSSYNLISLYLGLELFSFPLYAMIALNRRSRAASEAAIKYFIMGAIASGILLYGFSILFGITEKLQLVEVAKGIAALDNGMQLVAVFAMVFIVAGLAFKFGAVPFHMWVPDVYHGAPTPVTLLITSAPKLAALALALRLLVDAMPDLNNYWQQMMIVISIASIFLGNLVAIAQSNFKRMLAYSSIAHMGYLFLGLVAANPEGFTAAMFYTVTYAIMSAGGFAAIVLMSRAGFEAENIADFKGLNSRNPWFAFMILILMFSMAGIPPFVGFWAKVGVFEALIDVHLTWLAAVAIIFAVIGCYYYLRVVKVMYFEDPDDSTLVDLPLDMQIAISINGIAILALGIAPGVLIDFCRSAILHS